MDVNSAQTMENVQSVKKMMRKLTLLKMNVSNVTSKSVNTAMKMTNALNVKEFIFQMKMELNAMTVVPLTSALFVRMMEIVEHALMDISSTKQEMLVSNVILITVKLVQLMISVHFVRMVPHQLLMSVFQMLYVHLTAIPALSTMSVTSVMMMTRNPLLFSEIVSLAKSKVALHAGATEDAQHARKRDSDPTMTETSASSVMSKTVENARMMTKTSANSAISDIE